MTTERELLAAVMAAPDDDAPRLVYADWLTTRGDARGEFIATQCALGHTVWRNRVEPRRRAARGGNALVARERALLRAHEEQWAAALAWLHDIGWRRGFPFVATCDGGALAWHAASLAAVPLAALRLTGGADAARAALPPPTLRALALGHHVDTEQVMRAAWSNQLRALTFDPLPLMSRSGADALMAALPASLSRLCISGALGIETLEALAATVMTRWTHVGLRAWSWEVTPRALQFVEHATALVYLELRGNSRNPRVWQWLVATAPPALRVLHLDEALWRSLSLKTQSALTARFEILRGDDRRDDPFTVV